MKKNEVNIKGFKCLRCSHIWMPRKKTHPRVCPKCMSPYWDISKQVKQ